jgi:hypothetical protein
VAVVVVVPVWPVVVVVVPVLSSFPFLYKLLSLSLAV